MEGLKTDILYVYVLGLKKTMWNNFQGNITIIPEYYGSSENFEIPSAALTFNFYKPSAIDSIADVPLKQSELISKDVIDYLHVVRGISCNELTFSAKTDLVYDDLIVGSESNTFPWIADDFEDGVPKKKIDSLFNMSPWVFPRNYFYDVCLENEYQRVVGVVLKRSQLTDLPIEALDSDSSLDDIIGSIRWIVKGE